MSLPYLKGTSPHALIPKKLKNTPWRTFSSSSSVEGLVQPHLAACPSTYLHLWHPVILIAKPHHCLTAKTQKQKGEQKLCCLNFWRISTFDLTLAVLRDHTCAILLARWPFVYVQSCVWGSSIQNNPILQKQLETDIRKHEQERENKVKMSNSIARQLKNKLQLDARGTFSKLQLPRSHSLNALTWLAKWPFAKNTQLKSGPWLEFGIIEKSKLEDLHKELRMHLYIPANCFVCVTWWLNVKWMN